MFHGQSLIFLSGSGARTQSSLFRHTFIAPRVILDYELWAPTAPGAGKNANLQVCGWWDVGRRVFFSVRPGITLMLSNIHSKHSS